MATSPASVGFLNALTSGSRLRDARQARDLRTHRLPRVLCQQRHGGEDERSRLLLDRRDVLVALGGLYGTAAGQMARASPVMPPAIGQNSSCKMAVDKFILEQDPNSDLLKCCPPYQGTSVDIVDYTFPRTPIRVRRPAHLVGDDPEYMEKYKEAVQKMKDLPADDPWNFYQQAKIHCAYCNDGYFQVKSKSTIQVHFSWIFLPWHRYYLHFYERILGRLIDDDTFALPYWNFDTPDGMTMPAIFTDKSSPLYDDLRNKSHFPPTVVDFKYSLKDDTGPSGNKQEVIDANLEYLRKLYAECKMTPKLFMGGKVSAGEQVAFMAKTKGSLEDLHNIFHQWGGRPDPPYTDMGSFATSGRDCLFYCLHANVDRMWQIYRNLRGNRVEFNDTDWLDATFIFYDENRKVVRVKVRDSLNPTKLCYTFEEVPLPWLTKQPRKKAAPPKTKVSLAPVGEFGSKPRELTDTIRALVRRPKTKRSKADKLDKAEVLLVKDIETDSGPARFDVYLAKPFGDLAGPDLGDLVGCYVKLPDTSKAAKGELDLGITEELDELDAEDADKLVVSLVPRGGDVTIGGLQIELVQSD